MRGRKLCTRENRYAHFPIDINLLGLLFVLDADLLARGLNGAELADVEVLLGLDANLVGLVVRLLADERDHLLDLLLNLRVVHDRRNCESDEEEDAGPNRVASSSR
jgi:hypothetical protein